MSLLGSIDARGLPRVPLLIRGPYGAETVSAIVDTGFTGAVSLSEDLVRRLGLRQRDARPTVLADGTLRLIRVYLVDVDWLGSTVTAVAFESRGPDATIGAGLLRGRELTIDYGTQQSVEVR